MDPSTPSPENVLVKPEGVTDIDFFKYRWSCWGSTPLYNWMKEKYPYLSTEELVHASRMLKSGYTHTLSHLNGVKGTVTKQTANLNNLRTELMLKDEKLKKATEKLDKTEKTLELTEKSLEDTAARLETSDADLQKEKKYSALLKASLDTSVYFLSSTGSVQAVLNSCIYHFIDT